MNKKTANLFLTSCFLFIALSGIRPAHTVEDETWKDRWYVNTVWYQIFPDRFYNGDTANDPEFSEKYDLKGNLIPLQVTPWIDDKPTYISKYGGDLTGVSKKLTYLHDLGISGIWFNPIFKATSNHKYNTADYAVIDPEFGDRSTFKTLISKAHEQGIKVICDGVFNHTGYEFWAFQDIIAKGENSSYKNWYFIDSYPVKKLWEQTKDNKPNYRCWWGFGSLPQLNLDNEDTRGYIIDTCKGWLKTGIDGWRLDVPEEVKSESFWNEWCREMRREKSDVYLTGEIWGEAGDYLSRDRFDAVMNYHGFREPVLQFFSAEKLTVSAFDKLLTQRRSLYPHSTNCALQNLLSSHDTVRIATAVRNKDQGDSDKDHKKYDLSPVDDNTLARLKMIAVFHITYVGAPMIYYGDEIGMTGGKDPDCRKPMIWDEGRQIGELLSWYKKLIHIRNSHKSLRTGDFKTLITNDRNKVYAYSRTEKNESLIICINYSTKTVKVNLPAVKGGEYCDLLSAATFRAGRKLSINLLPMNAVILENLSN